MLTQPLKRILACGFSACAITLCIHSSTLFSNDEQQEEHEVTTTPHFTDAQQARFEKILQAYEFYKTHFPKKK